MNESTPVLKARAWYLFLFFPPSCFVFLMEATSIPPGTPNPRLGIRCFNCGGNHHVRDCLSRNGAGFYRREESRPQWRGDGWDPTPDGRRPDSRGPLERPWWREEGEPKERRHGRRKRRRSPSSSSSSSGSRGGATPAINVNVVNPRRRRQPGLCFEHGSGVDDMVRLMAMGKSHALYICRMPGQFSNPGGLT